MDTRYFQPWTLDKLYQVEPELKDIATRVVAQKRRRFWAKLDAYLDELNI